MSKPPSPNCSTGRFRQQQYVVVRVDNASKPDFASVAFEAVVLEFATVYQRSESTIEC